MTNNNKSNLLLIIQSAIIIVVLLPHYMYIQVDFITMIVLYLAITLILLNTYVYNYYNSVKPNIPLFLFPLSSSIRVVVAHVADYEYALLIAYTLITIIVMLFDPGTLTILSSAGKEKALNMLGVVLGIIFFLSFISCKHSIAWMILGPIIELIIMYSIVRRIGLELHSRVHQVVKVIISVLVSIFVLPNIVLTFILLSITLNYLKIILVNKKHVWAIIVLDYVARIILVGDISWIIDIL